MSERTVHERAVERERGSWILVPASKRERVAEAARAGADVVVLDLVELVVEAERNAARENVRSSLREVQGGGAEVFVQTDPKAYRVDLEPCVAPGLSGVIVSRVESPQEVEALSGLLDRLERERGIQSGTIRIVAAVETARGNHAAYDIARASSRVWGVTLGRADLIMDLRPEPSQEIHLMSYLMQRLIIIARAAGVRPLGAWWRAPDRGLLATPENSYEAARRGRAIGFKGAMCLRVNQVEPLNRAFS